MKPNVRFTQVHRRLPLADEASALRDFCDHVDRCSYCHINENERIIQCRMCSKGVSYGQDLHDYLSWNAGAVHSALDTHITTPERHVIIHPQWQKAEIYLRFTAEKRRQMVRARRHDRGPWSSVYAPVVNIKPTISSVVHDRRKDTVYLQVTVPTFTIPVVMNSGQGADSRRRR